MSHIHTEVSTSSAGVADAALTNVSSADAIGAADIGLSHFLPGERSFTEDASLGILRPGGLLSVHMVSFLTPF